MLRYTTDLVSLPIHIYIVYGYTCIHEYNNSGKLYDGAYLPGQVVYV